MFTNRMIICDMDGTLLDSSSSISRENIAALEYFTENGGLFTVATGRIPVSVRPYVSLLPVNIPGVLYNGAMIYDFSEEKILWENPVSEETCSTVKELIEEFPGAGIEIYHGDQIFIVTDNCHTEKHIAEENICVNRTTVDNVPFPWLKVLIAWENKKLMEVEKWLDDKHLPFRHTFSGEIFLEFLDLHSSKGHALERLAKMIMIPMENVYAIGDNMNDLEMIEMAGTGIAVSNAVPELIKAADICMPNNDDHAIAHAVEWIEKDLYISR